MPDILPHLERNLAQAEALGETKRAQKLKARIAKIQKDREPKPAKKVEPKPSKKTSE